MQPALSWNPARGLFPAAGGRRVQRQGESAWLGADGRLRPINHLQNHAEKAMTWDRLKQRVPVAQLDRAIPS